MIRKSTRTGASSMTLEQIRKKYANDRFATDAAGVRIISAEPGHAVCAMPVTPIHRNALGNPQGGAIFTLADFTFAVASNAFSEYVSVSMQHDITFLRTSRGTELTAEAFSIRDGRHTCFYRVDVTDDCGALIAVMTVNGFVTAQKNGDVSPDSTDSTVNA